MIIVGAFSNLVPDCLDDNDDNVFLLLSFEMEDCPSLRMVKGGRSVE